MLQAPLVSLRTGARVEAQGGPRADGAAANGYFGAGGAGRIRVDAALLMVDGVAVDEATFAAMTRPGVGFFGSATPPVASVVTPGSTGGDVVIAYSVSDDDSFLWIDVEVSIDGGSFQAATPAASSAPTSGLKPGAHTFTWSSAAQAPGARSVQVRVRASDVREGPWSTSGTFTVSN